MANILLVEDEAQLRSMLHLVLEDAGHTVREAGDGAEALVIYRREPADIVVTDLVMPNKEGIEMIIELRRICPDVKVIAMSGGGRNGPQDYLTLAKRLGASLTLTKPFSNQEMLNAVNSLLETCAIH